MTSTIQTVNAQAVAAEQQAGKPVRLIDVRTPIEFAEVHAVGARNVPLDQLNTAELLADPAGADEPIYLICKSGGRAGKACEALIAAGGKNIFSVAGGTDAWIAAGLGVERKSVMSLERQVRIAAGLLVLTGVALGSLANAWFYALSAFVGAGLVFAGITNTCGMGLLLARMPWNRVGCDTRACCGNISSTNEHE